MTSAGRAQGRGVQTLLLGVVGAGIDLILDGLTLARRGLTAGRSRDGGPARAERAQAGAPGIRVHASTVRVLIGPL